VPSCESANTCGSGLNIFEKFVILGDYGKDLTSGVLEKPMLDDAITP
jgi:hypothetical protein